MGKNKQYNKPFEVVSIGDRRQGASLVLLSVPCAAVRSTALVGPACLHNECPMYIEQKACDLLSVVSLIASGGHPWWVCQ